MDITCWAVLVEVRQQLGHCSTSACSALLASPGPEVKMKCVARGTHPAHYPAYDGSASLSATVTAFIILVPLLVILDK